MIRKELVVKNPHGIHARPSSLIVKTAIKYTSDIQLIKGDTSADAKSIMSVMMLAAACDTTLTLQVSGRDEHDAAAAIVSLFERKFEEE